MIKLYYMVLFSGQMKNEVSEIWLSHYDFTLFMTLFMCAEFKNRVHIHSACNIFFRKNHVFPFCIFSQIRLVKAYHVSIDTSDTDTMFQAFFVLQPI